MAEMVRLSEASRRVAEALERFDQPALDRLAATLNAAYAGELPVEREPVEAIQSRQRMLAAILTATEQNIHLLRRLRQRNARNKWGL